MWNKEQLGIWACFQVSPGKRLLGTLQEYNNCEGDILYDWMAENIEDFDIEDYDCEGDSEYVAVMAKEEGFPEYGWEFHARLDGIKGHLCPHNSPGRCGDCDMQAPHDLDE